jgi:hypothetical protein
MLLIFVLKVKGSMTVIFNFAGNILYTGIKNRIVLGELLLIVCFSNMKIHYKVFVIGFKANTFSGIRYKRLF